MEMSQRRFKVGDRIRIIRMDGEPEYSGRDVLDDAFAPAYELAGAPEKFHGTWGFKPVYPDLDKIEIIQQGE